MNFGAWKTLTFLICGCMFIDYYKKYCDIALSRSFSSVVSL